MSELIQTRLVAAFVPLLLILAACAGDSPTNVEASPRPSIVVGEPGGEVTTTDSPAPATPVPTVTPARTPSPTPAPTPPPVAADGFSAQVFACQSISGSACNGQLGTLPPRAGSFTALVRFTNGNAGDTLNAVLTGPAGTIAGGGYTLQGSGDGYYYTTFTAGNLPPGTYTVTATRNGAVIATTSFQRG